MFNRIVSLKSSLSSLRNKKMNDLLIPLKEDSRFPMYRQIYDHIKNEIQKGKMKAGEKLPSSRLLAKNLCISRSTVDMAL